MADYCSDVFKMVEDNEDSFRMWQGLVGPYYTPQMSQDGTLRWSNNGGLPNPDEVNLRGPQGAGIRIAGLAETEAGLPSRSDVGGIWLVGTELPYEGWAFLNGEWIDLGPLTVGPAGPPGPQGDDYELTENDKNEIAGLAAAQFVTQLESDPLPIRSGGTDARDLAGAQENLGIAEILTKLGVWPLGTDAQDVAGAINEMIGEIAAQNAGIAELREIQADIDAAQGVGQFLYGIKVGHHEVVNAQPGQLVDGGHGAAGSAVAQGAVELAEVHRRIGVSGIRVGTCRQRHQEVAGETHHCDVGAVRGHVHQHHDVGVVGVLAFAVVRAQHQDLHRIGVGVRREPILVLADIQRLGVEVALQPQQLHAGENESGHQRQGEQHCNRGQYGVSPARGSVAQMTAAGCGGRPASAWCGRSGGTMTCSGTA